jgi:calmodulin
MASSSGSRGADAATPRPQVAEFKAAFDLVDVDRSGAISVAELEKVLKYLGKDPSAEALDALMRDVDSDASGQVRPGSARVGRPSNVGGDHNCTPPRVARNPQIEFAEFLRLMEQEQVEKELRAAFDRMDVRGVGRISAQDLKQAMAAQGQVLTAEEVQEMMEEADADGTGGCAGWPHAPAAAQTALHSRYMVAESATRFPPGCRNSAATCHSPPATLRRRDQL